MFNGLIYNYRDFLNYQEQIFELAFGFFPQENKLYISPFRDDSDPGCRFEWSGDFLYFIDNARFQGQLKFNCFQAIKIMYNLETIQGCCNFIKNKLNTITISSYNKAKKNKHDLKKNEIIIKATFKAFPEENYYTQFGLTKEHLDNDPEVFNIDNYWCNTKNDSKLIYNRFGKGQFGYYFKETNHLKLYFPSFKEFRWYSNCTIDDIFNWCYINEFNKDLLIITKSKKDALILWLVHNIPAIGLQNEGCSIPQDKLDVIKTFKKNILLFDNDSAGQKAANIICNRYEFENKTFKNSLPKDVGEVQLFNNKEIKKLIYER